MIRAPVDEEIDVHECLVHEIVVREFEQNVFNRHWDVQQDELVTVACRVRHEVACNLECVKQNRSIHRHVLWGSKWKIAFATIPARQYTLATVAS